MRRRFITFSRIVRTGVVNFGRNVPLAIAAMAVMVVTLTIVLFSLVANATFANTIQQINNKINVSVYLADNVTQEQVNELTRRIKSQPNVKSVSYVSKDQALTTFQKDETNSKSDLLQQAVNETGNPLPASIRIDPKDPGDLQSIKNFLDKPENAKLQDSEAGGTSYSGDSKEAVDQITHATNVLQRIGVVAVAIFAIVSVLIIFNTIQMAIFNRRDEIQIMRLLGANTGYIRGPFVVEAILYGFISGAISVLIINTTFVAASSALQASSLGLLDISYAADYFKEHFFLLLAMQLTLGILIGALSSIIATRRYLKFKIK